MSGQIPVSTGDQALATHGLVAARMPRHVAIIMDGNGRWARQRGWARFLGHQHGVGAVRAVATTSARLGIPWLTLYAFSSENWDRPAREVSLLMDLLQRFVVEERPTLMDNRIRLRAIGRLDRLPEAVRSALDETVRLTAGHVGLNLTLALSYGGREELVDACRRLAAEAVAGRLDPSAIGIGHFQQALYLPEAPDVDLLIRTAGEQRVSNFLPWQAAYAEYVGLADLWPEVREPHLIEALKVYQGRERRFGKV